MGSYLVESSTPEHIRDTNFRATLNGNDESQQILKRSKVSSVIIAWKIIIFQTSQSMYPQSFTNDI